jgi:hypothetical protein
MGDHVTEDRALKLAIRRRMEQTGEKYTEARRALSRTYAGGLRPGEVRTVVVAWRLDDPAVQDDGRFWTEVPSTAAEVFARPAGAIIPSGQSLRSWRERSDDNEVEVPNPITGHNDRFSLSRWSHADPDRTQVILSFFEVPVELAGRPHEEVERIRDEQLARCGATRVIKRELPQDVEQLKNEQTDLQRDLRAARDAGDAQRAAKLTPALEAIGRELARVDFPHHTRGWDLSRAIRQDTGTYALDWTTGY